MKISVFAVVSALFQNIPKSVTIANRFQEAYYAGIGKPEDNTPFSENSPNDVAMNVAGLDAADSAANCIAQVKTGYVNETNYLKALEAIAEGRLNADETCIALNMANVAWRAGQPFRDMATKPLNRLARPVNAQFNTLPDYQQAKDLIQVVLGAQILLEEIAAVAKTEEAVAA